MRMTVPAFKEFTLTRARTRKSVRTQHSSWLKRTEERSMKMAPVGDGTSGVRFGEEEERLRRHRGRKNKTSLPGMRVLVSSL